MGVIPRSILILTLALVSFPLTAKSAGEIFRENKDAIVNLRMEGYLYENGAWGLGGWTCSGFVIDPSGMIATNGHCVDGATSGIAIFSDGSQLRISGIRAFEYGDSLFFRGQSGLDSAVIQVAGFDLPTVKLGNSNAVGVGDEIVVVGYPMQSDFESLGETIPSPTITQGIIASERVLEGVRQLGIDASISSGNSGGPVFNEEGAVIGLATWHLTSGQNLNFVQPINYLRGLDRSLIMGSIPGFFSDPRSGNGEGDSGSSSRTQMSDPVLRETGRLESGDETLDSGEYLDVVTLDGVEGQRVQIHLTSTEFDPYLLLMPPSGSENALQAADDGSGIATLDVTLSETGEYLVGITSMVPGETGDWNLCLPDCSSPMVPFFGDVPWLTSLDEADTLLRGLGAVNRYPEEKGSRLAEGDFPYLEIYDATLEDGQDYEMRLYFNEEMLMVKAVFVIDVFAALANNNFGPELCVDFYDGFLEGTGTMNRLGAPTESMRRLQGEAHPLNAAGDSICQSIKVEEEGTLVSDWWATRGEWIKATNGVPPPGPTIDAHSLFMKLIPTDDHTTVRLIILWEHDSILVR